MLFKKLRNTLNQIQKTKENIITNGIVDIDIEAILLQLYGPINNKDDLEYIRDTYINKHKYDNNFSIDKLCLEMNFILPILQVHYKDFNINRLSMILLNNQYLVLLSDYIKSNDKHEKMATIIFIKVLLDFIKDNIVFKNVNYMIKLRNNLHMVCDENIFRRYFTIKDIRSLSYNKQILLNVISHYDIYSLEALEYIFKNNVYINIPDEVVKLIEPYLDKYVEDHEKIDASYYTQKAMMNMFKLSILFSDRQFMAKIKRYKLYYKKYKTSLCKLKNNYNSIQKILDLNYEYKIADKFVYNEIHTITKPSSKDIKVLNFMKDIM